MQRQIFQRGVQLLRQLLARQPVFWRVAFVSIAGKQFIRVKVNQAGVAVGGRAMAGRNRETGSPSGRAPGCAGSGHEWRFAECAAKQQRQFFGGGMA